MVSHADIAAVPSCSRAVSPAFSHPILTVISALIRRRKIIERLSIARGNGACVSIWHDSTTCLLASVYIVIPLLLFRIQDKTAAISETSPFAAIIVAFSYDQIIAGKDSRTKTPRAGRSDARHERDSPATKRVDKRDDDTGGGESMTDRKHCRALVALATALMVSTGCGTVSQQTVELSTEVTARVKDLEQAHLLAVDAYFDGQRARVDAFLEEKWTPLFLRNFVGTSGILQDLQAPQSVSQTTVRELEVALGEYLTDPGEAPEATRRLVRAINQGRGHEPATVASTIRAFVPDDRVDAASLHIAALLQVETAGVLMMEWSQAATEQIVARRDSLLAPIEAARRQAILEIRQAYADVYAGQGVITGRLEAAARRSTEEAKLVELVGGEGTAAQLNAKLVAYAEAVNAAFSKADKLVEGVKSGSQKLDALEGTLSAGLEAAATEAGLRGTEALSPPGGTETTTGGTP